MLQSSNVKTVFRYHPYARRSLIFFCITCTLFMGVVISAVFVQANSNSLQDDARIVRQESDKRGKIAAMAKTFAEHGLLVESINTKLSLGFSQADLTTALHQLASDTGISIIQEEVSRQGLADGVDMFVQDMVVSGPYAAIRLFVSGIQELDYFTVVETLRILKNQDGPAVEARLRLNTYKKQAAS